MPFKNVGGMHLFLTSNTLNIYDLFKDDFVHDQIKSTKIVKTVRILCECKKIFSNMQQKCW